MVASLRTPMPLVPSVDPTSGSRYMGAGTTGAPSSPMDSFAGGSSPSSPIASFAAAPASATNTDVLTSADMNKTDIQSSAIPTMGQGYGYGKNYATMPIGGVQSTAYQKPTDYLSPQAREYLGYGNAALGGVAAGGQVQPTTDSSDAALGVVGAGIGGAAAGAAAGPGGALLGGLAGLVTGGINAWVGTSSARAKQRKEDKIRQQIAAKDEERYQQARADAQKYSDQERGDKLEQERYNRRQAAVQSQWQAQETARRALNDAISNDASLKQMLIQEVR